MLRRISSALTLLLLASLPAAAQAAGKVAQMVPAGFIQRGTSTNEAKKADPVEWNDILRTNDAGRMRIALEDGSLLSVGARTELRVVKHDPQSNQTLVEMIYGRARANVVPIRKSGGSFQVRTPTAVIGVLGTTVDIETVSSVSTVTGDVIEKLPLGRQNISELLQLQPGAMPNKNEPDKPTIADALGVDATIVRSLDRIVGVRSIDPEIIKTVFVLPGQYTIVRRGMPPTDPQFGDPGQPQQPRDPGTNMAGGCPQFVDPRDFGKLFPEGQRPSYEIIGRGHSTGSVFDVKVKNPSGCPLNVLIPTGAVLEPTGYVGRVIKGLLLGDHMPPLKDFQVMMAEGGFGEAPPFPNVRLPRADFMFFVPPETDETVFTLRGYCLELHKLPPHAKTKYKFADPGDQAKFSAPNLKVMETAYKLFFTGQVRSQMHSLDTIAQWSIWASREGMNAKEFQKQFAELVEKNYKNQKKKYDKQAKAQTQAMAADLWSAVEKVLAAAK